MDDNKIKKEDDCVPKNGNSAVRDSLVNTAVQFLQNPNTRSSPLNMKKDFLKRKGLTDEEIEIAIQKSGIMNISKSAYDLNNIDQMNMNYPPPVVPTNYYYPQHAVPIQPVHSKLIFLRDLANTVVVLSGAAYLVYWCYKKYIEPFLFGPKKTESKKDSLEIQIIRLKEVVERINSNMERLEVKLELTSQKNHNEDQELITEITSLKGLLLNRKQFPATPQTSNVVVPASIPSWQLSENQPSNSVVVDTKKLESSPSNSSNNSTNNDGGSDCSLEMIKDQEEIINNK